MTNDLATQAHTEPQPTPYNVPTPVPYDSLPDQVKGDLLTVLVWCESYGRDEENAAAIRLLDYFVPDC